MPKNIIFCADGTWDTVASNTNVVKIYRALLMNNAQFVAYDDGVGTDGTPIEKLAGAAFGAGLFKKIQNGYTKIAQVYEAGDNIFIFGFSRGAYTARSLSGMIVHCGLPTASTFGPDLVPTAFAAYRNPALRPGLPTALAAYNMADVKITMVGVWDTVGSLGIPALFGGIETSYQFLDTSLHPNVLNACHAVSIDERREEFPSTAWNQAPAPGQTISQVYFAGVHCDVGGGYPDSTLADITLGWMMKKAAAAGAIFDPDILGAFSALDSQHALGMTHESWDPLWGYPKRRSFEPGVTLSSSVQTRCQYNPSYRPANLDLDPSGLPAASYGISTV